MRSTRTREDERSFDCPKCKAENCFIEDESCWVCGHTFYTAEEWEDLELDERLLAEDDDEEKTTE